MAEPPGDEPDRQNQHRDADRIVRAPPGAAFGFAEAFGQFDDGDVGDHTGGDGPVEPDRAVV